MLHSRKGPYQSLMAREDIRIKRVPSALAYALASELEGRVQLDNIYFARSADPNAPKWQVFDRKDRYGDIDTDFKDVVLQVQPGRRPEVPRRARDGLQAQVPLQGRGAAHGLAALRVGLCAHGAGRFVAREELGGVGPQEGQQKVKVAVEEQLTDPGPDLDDEHDDDEVVAKRRGPRRARMPCWATPGRA